MTRLYAVPFLFLMACSTEDTTASLTTSPGVELEALAHTAEPSPLPPATPADVVQAFFYALHADDMDGIQRVMLPNRYQELIEDPHMLQRWLSLWKRCKVVRTGAVPPFEEDASEPVSIRLPVDYDCDWGEFSDSITITRLDGRWYWDEN